MFIQMSIIEGYNLTGGGGGGEFHNVIFIVKCKKMKWTQKIKSGV